MFDRSWDRPPPTARQVRVDVVIALVAALLGIVSVEVYRSASGVSVGWRGAEAYLWFALAGLLLAGRRRFPLTTLVLLSAVFYAIGERFEQLGAVITIQVAMFAAFYAAWAWSRRPRALVSLTAVIVVAMFVWVLLELREPEALNLGNDTGLLSPLVAVVIYSLAINVFYFFGAIAWGQAAWMSARRRATIADQMAREREQNEAERRRAVQTERVRIARDLHDVVAHHVSGIGVQAAGASRLLDSRPDAARAALTTIETSSRQAVSQMHQLVGLLREAGDERADRGPQPGLGDIAGLVGSTDGVGVEYQEVGDRFDVPPTVGVSLYRVTQEALTNVRRHAGARRATVTVRYVKVDEGPCSAEVEILDDGRGGGATEQSGGYGLTGIRERAAMHDGEVEIGPRPNGGFRVRVRIPVDPSPTTQEET